MITPLNIFRIEKYVLNNMKKITIFIDFMFKITSRYSSTLKDVQRK